jgi:hypothetical protein
MIDYLNPHRIYTDKPTYDYPIVEMDGTITVVQPIELEK